MFDDPRRCNAHTVSFHIQLTWAVANPVPFARAGSKTYLRGRHQVVCYASNAVGRKACGSLRGKMAENSDSMLLRRLIICLASADGAFAFAGSAFAKMRGGGKPF